MAILAAAMLIEVQLLGSATWHRDHMIAADRELLGLTIPVILLTGRDRAGNFDRALKAGIDAFLQKPVQNTRLLAVIRQALAPWHAYG